MVEILVVITIIVVLAVITLSVAGRMRDSANRSRTTNNLRQIGAALLSYTADNNKFPDRLGNLTWDTAIISQMGVDADFKGKKPVTRTQFPQIADIAKIFTTPEDKEKRNPAYYPRSFAIVPWTTNWSDGTSFRGWKDRPKNVGIPYAFLNSPETSAMVVPWYAGESSIPNFLGSGNHEYHDQGGPTDKVGSEQQVLFADGHIERVPAKLTGKAFIDKYWPGTIGSTN